MVEIVPSVKKIQDLRTWKVLFEFLMNKTKTCIVSSSPKAKKMCSKGEKDVVGWNFRF